MKKKMSREIAYTLIKIEKIITDLLEIQKSNKNKCSTHNKDCPTQLELNSAVIKIANLC